MVRPTEISSVQSPRSKARSSSLPVKIPKHPSRSPERVTKPSKKPSKVKSAKKDGRYLQLVEADGTIVESTPVPKDFDVKLQDLLENLANFKGAHSPKEVAPIPKAPLPEPQGIKRNNTAFCYRLALLQALAHAPAFCAGLGSSPTTSGHNSSKCLACALHRVLDCYSFSPQDLAPAVTHFHQVLRRTTQPTPWDYCDPSTHADAHEFFTWLVDVVETQHASSPAADLLQAALGVEVEARWTCERCERVHKKTDREMGLSLAITAPKRGLTLSSYLRAYMNEKVEVRCDGKGCGSNMERQRQKRFTALPPVLVVQMKRFEFCARGMRKIDGRVHFPGQWDLKGFVGEDEVESTEFELVAYVAHSGTLARGHYVAMVKGPQGIYEIDDDAVKKRRDWDDVPMGFAPYLLFYVQN
ncbi:MAG: hypothetical protein M1822_004449 [Bathelium mastoideum]|nr:MAG: hypothetical protein M1822_004449 [Bathelium mastoideum]